MKLKNTWAAFARFLQKHQTVCISVFLALLMLPIFIVGLYNRQSADDYGYSLLTHQALLQYGPNPLRLIQAAFATSVKYWYTWHGHYTAAFVMSLHPGIFAEKLYALSPVLVVGFTSMCVFYCFRRLCGALCTPNRGWTVLSGLFLFYIWQCLPSPVQGIYWYNSAFYYMGFWGLSMLNLALMVQLWNADTSKKRLRYCLLLTFSSILISGSNQVSAFFNLLLLATCVLALFLAHRKPQYALLPLMVGIAAFLLSLCSPATNVRLETLELDYNVVRPSAVKAVIDCIIKAIFFPKEWLGPSFFLYLLVITPIALRLARKLRGKLSFWVAPGVFVFTMALIAGMLCPPYYAMGDFGAGRLTNIVWATFVMGVTFSYILALGWLCQTNLLHFPSGFSVPQGAECLTVMLLCCLIVFYGNNISYSTTAYALQELADGQAKQYAAELDARIDIYNDPTVLDVEVDPITVGPYLLYFSDISTDLTDWKNTDTALYYGKNSVVLTKPVDLD